MSRCVDRLDQEIDAERRGPARGHAQIVDVGLARRAVGREPGHDVQARTAQRFCVVQREIDGGGELVLAAGQRGKPALAFVPMAGRQIEQHKLQAVRVEPRADIGGRHGVRKHELDALEARFRGRVKAIKEWKIQEQEAQVRGEAGHGCSHLDGGDQSNDFDWRSFFTPPRCTLLSTRRALAERLGLVATRRFGT